MKSWRQRTLRALIEQAGFGGYYWTIYQAEIATDVMFQDRCQIAASC